MMRSVRLTLAGAGSEIADMRNACHCERSEAISFHLRMREFGDCLGAFRRLAMTRSEASAAAVLALGLLGVGGRRWRGRGGQPVLDLRFDLLELVVLGLEILGVRPL